MTDADDEFEAVFLQHYAAVLRILIRLVGDRLRAEEVASDVFWKLSGRSRHWLLTSNVGGWLYRTATHAGIDALRASRRRNHYETAAALHSGAQESAESGPLHAVLREECRDRVRTVLRAMKPAQAQLLLMRASGSSYKELAEVFGVARTGIGAMLNRAEKEFRKRYLKL